MSSVLSKSRKSLSASETTYWITSQQKGKNRPFFLTFPSKLFHWVNKEQRRPLCRSIPANEEELDYCHFGNPD